MFLFPINLNQVKFLLCNKASPIFRSSLVLVHPRIPWRTRRTRVSPPRRSACHPLASPRVSPGGVRRSPSKSRESSCSCRSSCHSNYPNLGSSPFRGSRHRETISAFPFVALSSSNERQMVSRRWDRWSSPNPAPWFSITMTRVYYPVTDWSRSMGSTWMTNRAKRLSISSRALPAASL